MLVESRPFAVLDGLLDLYGLKYDSVTAYRLSLYLYSYKLVDCATRISKSIPPIVSSSFQQIHLFYLIQNTSDESDHLCNTN